ncbi:uncharacterized protein LOC131604464 [Vicia villosa]|uniref:uncharacterized protein LOC131604464 n=1 Tax=Vicia villosa TaxID=3911 RepID=UPI00273C6DF4|nr:uncharacterized protein LOC131604464 [Vicia villosa]
MAQIKRANLGVQQRLSCYYGFPERSRRRQAWDMIRDLRNMSSILWGIIGDFNDLLSQNDKQDLHPHPEWLCAGFQQIVGDCNLTNIPLEGHPFTWVKSRGTAHMIEERHDRSLANSDWLQLFPNSKLHNLRPILLCCDPLIHKQTKKGFKFENWWLKEAGVEEVISDGWLPEGSHNVTDRIASCASTVDRWNRGRIKHHNAERDSLRVTLEALCSSSNPANIAKYMATHNDYNKVLIRDDIY